MDVVLHHGGVDAHSTSLHNVVGPRVLRIWLAALVTGPAAEPPALPVLLNVLLGLVMLVASRFHTVCLNFATIGDQATIRAWGSFRLRMRWNNPISDELPRKVIVKTVYL